MVCQGFNLKALTGRMMKILGVACVLLALAGAGCKQKERVAMTRDEAVRLIQQFAKAEGTNTSGLNENNLGGLGLGSGDVYFEYQLARHTLKCSALIYRFRKDPKLAVIEGFYQAERERWADTGGGSLEFQTENKGLYLSRSYDQSLPDNEFERDLKRLLKAAEVWGDEVLNRVADRAGGHDKK